MDVGEKLQTPCEGTSAVWYVSNKEKGNSAQAQDKYKKLIPLPSVHTWKKKKIIIKSKTAYF